MVDRPTFSESWYRVADLRPKLRGRVQVYRQHYRGRPWHVLRDPTDNQFFRLDDSAYHFIGLLDGRRTVAQVWDLCSEELGDAAPTQGEAIQLLGQLYASNLLQGDLPPDAQSMFERYRKRVRREVTGYLSNFLFIRIPLFDPEPILKKWVGVFGWLYSWPGFALWLTLAFFAIRAVIGRSEELFSSTGNVLDPSNLPLLYLSFTAIKAVHEFGHGFACKKFGRDTHTGGEVHTLGIMLLVLMPVPYVDASTAWAFRNKWHRAIVGAGGMYFELMVAAVAAIVWANTGPGTVHSIAYNLLFVASFSTILFNGNPLIRFDGYYILSDLLETPNLAQRSKDYTYYLVRRFVYGVKRARTPANTPGERFWLLFYAIASGIYRVIISVGIVLFVADKLFFIGAIMAIGAIVGWVVVPIGKWVKYLMTSPELAKTRNRAVAVTAASALLLVAGIGLVPMPDRGRAQGVVEPRRMMRIHAEASGFIDHMMPNRSQVGPATDLVRAHNIELVTRRDELLAERAKAQAELRMAQVDEPAVAQSLRARLASVERQLEHAQEQIDRLSADAPFEGVWLSPDAEDFAGAYIERGRELGIVATLDDLVVRIAADQSLGPRIAPDNQVEMRVKGRPSQQLTGRIERILPAGQERLPSPALGFAAGGPIQVRQDDEQGTRTVEPFFDVQVIPDAPEQLMMGQRVVVRFEAPPTPLAVQWYRLLRQLLQRRFQV